MSASERVEERDAYMEVLEKLYELFFSLLNHNGYGDIRVEMRILKFGQKEVIVHCGKQYRYVVDFPIERVRSASRKGGGGPKESDRL